MEKIYDKEQKKPLVQKKSNGGTISKSIDHSVRQQEAHVVQRRRSLGRREKIRYTLKNKFYGRLNNFDSDKNSLFYEARESLIGKLSTFSNAISYKTIAREILYDIKEIHKDVVLVPEHRYAYRISVNVYPDSNVFNVSVRLINKRKHKKAGLKALEKEKAKELEKNKHLIEEKEKKAKEKLAADEKWKAEVQDMKLIIMPNGQADLVKREVWEAKEKKLLPLITNLYRDISSWKKQLDKSYNEAGIIARIGYAYSGHGVTYSKPDLDFYWTSAYEYQINASIALLKQDFFEAEFNMLRAIESVKEAEKIWTNWLRDSARGAGTVVNVLSFAKYSGQIAASSLATLTGQPQISTLYSVIQEEADQVGKFISGTDADKAFSVGKIAKAGAMSYLTGKLGEKLGLKLIAKFGLSGVASKCIANFLASSALSEVVKRVDNKILNQKSPDDVILMLADNPTVQNIFKTLITKCK